ncbi:NADH-quinone oxidoreductase subunit C [Mucilaginibacter sp. KACC 22773]|uniref:NADH-quinone oxidoreductase subunit C n=1 Tax=Mucilaginibacter sp. KACC 22773 TaxID=3025671 RepID=UPI0023652A72|nr:NADH-quinone oxidoreductase subunit C [Mucilaginibacter sp. KACC 22773]WDF76185.1 NADH-quinone oxidoreductase subunit C [Mucilaginibacter sp. KACC 22773]
MMFNDIKLLLIQKFGEAVIAGEETGGLQPALLINPDDIDRVCLELRNNPKTYFDFLSSISGLHYNDETNRYGVVYHLASIPYKTQLTLKISKPHDRESDQLPEFKSITAIYRTADWHEREAYDLLGIFFTNHPDLRRILLPDDWDGFPLRKDYKTAEYYKGIKID